MQAKIPSTRWNSDDFEQYDKSIPHSYQNPDVLWHLYHTKGKTQQEIANRYNISQSTVSRWIRRYGIKSGHGNGSLSVYPNKPDNTEYLIFDIEYDGERTLFSGHQLVALHNNSLEDVFSHKTVVHHRVPTSVGMDFPENLEVLTRSEHGLLHSQGETLDDVEEVLDGDDTA